VRPDVVVAGDGPPLVLSTSIGATHEMWDSQANALSGRFRVIRYDHRGHGSAPVPPGPYSLADLGGDVVALLDELGIERAHFCGLSLGGMVGMWLGEHAPERIDRLILMCTASKMDPSVWDERLVAIDEARSLEVTVDRTMERWFTERFRAEKPNTLASMRRMVATNDPDGYIGCARAIQSMQIDAALSTITAPTLVISGAHDPSTPPSDGEHIAAAIPGARLEIVDAAHLANVEQPDRVTALIEEHLT
jgi:3-oxoadipate enol-lactonase